MVFAVTQWLCFWLSLKRKTNMLLDADDSQLVLVDYQIKLMPAMLDAPGVIANAVRLARLAVVRAWQGGGGGARTRRSSSSSAGRG